jgi:hypothetical protein
MVRRPSRRGRRERSGKKMIGIVESPRAYGGHAWRHSRKMIKMAAEADGSDGRRHAINLRRRWQSPARQNRDGPESRYQYRFQSPHTRMILPVCKRGSPFPYSISVRTPTGRLSCISLQRGEKPHPTGTIGNETCDPGATYKACGTKPIPLQEIPAVILANSQRFHSPCALNRPQTQDITRARWGVSRRSAVTPATNTNMKGSAINWKPSPG